MRTENESSDQGWQEEEEGQGTRRCQQAARRHAPHQGDPHLGTLISIWQFIVPSEAFEARAD